MIRTYKNHNSKSFKIADFCCSNQLVSLNKGRLWKTLISQVFFSGFRGFRGRLTLAMGIAAHHVTWNFSLTFCLYLEAKKLLKVTNKMQAANPARKAVPKYMVRTMVGSTMLPGMPKNWPRLFFKQKWCGRKRWKATFRNWNWCSIINFAWKNLCHLVCQWFWICRLYVKQKPTFCDFCAQNTSNSTLKKGVKLLQHPRCIGMVTCRGKYWHLVPINETTWPSVIFWPEADASWNFRRWGIMLVKTEWTSKQEVSIG